MTATLAHEPSTTPVRAHAPIPFGRVVAVELRKMFDTRSGSWLLAAIAIAAILASTAVVLWVPDASLTYDTFAAAIGNPMVIILPVIAILSVTSEWSQRTGLTTFAFVPRRGRVVAAKLVSAVLVGVLAILIAAGIGAVGNVVGSAIAGVETVWDLGATQLSMIVLATVLSMLVGFMLAVLMRNSAAAIVGYFIYAFALVPLVELLAATQQWFADARPWIDLNFSQRVLFSDVPSSEQWAHLGVSGLLWLAIPLVLGLGLVLRSEVK